MSDAIERRRDAFKQWMERVDQTAPDIFKRSGVAATTIYSYLAGKSDSLKGTTEEQIANAYGITTDEIFSSQLVPLIGYVGADTEGTVVLSTGDERRDYVLKPPGGTTDSVALEVRGYSMRGIAEDGSLIYFEDQRNPPTEDMLGDIVILETEDGLVLVKRLLRGSARGLYDLESVVGPVLTDQRLKWAAFITAIVPRRQAQRIIRRSVA
jgi:hypothetical protein